MVDRVNLTNPQFRKTTHPQQTAQITPGLLNNTRQYRWDDRDSIQTNDGRMELAISDTDEFAFLLGDSTFRQLKADGSEETWVTQGDYGSVERRGLDSNSEFIAYAHNRDDLQVIDPRTHTQVFHEDINGESIGRAVYITEDNLVYTTDTDTAIFNFDGERLMQADNFENDVAYDIEVEESTGDYYLGMDNAEVNKYDSDGNLLWTTQGDGPIGAGTDFITGRVRTVTYDQENDNLFAGSDDNNVYRIDPSDGTLIWELYADLTTSNNDIKVTTLKSDGDLFAGDINGIVYDIAAIDGSFTEFNVDSADGTDIQDMVASPDSLNKVYLSFDGGTDQLRLVNTSNNTVEVVKDFAHNREVRALESFTDANGVFTLISQTDQEHYKTHDKDTLETRLSPDIFGRQDPRSVIYLPSENNYMMARDRSGLEFRDAATGNLARMFHQDGGDRESINRDIRYTELFGPFNGKVYIRGESNKVREYDVATQTISLLPRSPFQNIGNFHFAADANGDARVLINDEPHIIALDSNFDEIYRRLIPNGLRSVYTDGENDYVMLDNRVIQKRSPADGRILERDEYPDRMDVIRTDFKDKLLITDGNHPHLINKSDLSYYSAFDLAQGHHDFDNPVVDNANNRILFRQASPRNIYIQQVELDTTAATERKLYRGKIHSEDIYINGERIHDRRAAGDVYFLSNTVFGVDNDSDYVHVEGVEVNTEPRDDVPK